MSDYRTWLRQQEEREDCMGFLARTVRRDFKTWNGSQKQLRTLLQNEELLIIFENSLGEFRQSKKNYKRRTARGPYKLEYGDWTHVFKTKKEMTEYYRKLKNLGYERALTENEHKSLYALFMHHPHHPVYGFEKITVGNHDIDNTICFKVDNCPISYNLCITNMGNPDRIKIKYHDFFGAARMEVRDQIEEIERNHPDDHIDHVIYFSHLLHDWLHETGHKIKDIGCTGSSYELRFCDRMIAKQWQDYHRQHSILRSITAIENLGRKPAKLDWSIHA